MIILLMRSRLGTTRVRGVPWGTPQPQMSVQTAAPALVLCFLGLRCMFLLLCMIHILVFYCIMCSRLGMTAGLGAPLGAPLPKTSAQTAARGLLRPIHFFCLLRRCCFVVFAESRFNPKLGLNATPFAMHVWRFLPRRNV